MIQNPKVKLSPRLRLGVGRSSGHRSILPYATLIILVISGVLGIRAINLVVKGSTSEAPIQGSVLGASDTSNISEQKELFKDYTVQKGDTIFSIGQKHNIEWTTLATLNSLEAPFTLKLDQTLKIPQQ